MLWHPTEPKIHDWFDKKAREFAEGENQNPRLTTEDWLGRYIYSDIHEIFFVEFLIALYEWLAQLTFQKKIFQGGKPDQWTPELIQQLRRVNNKASRVVDVWIDNILEGYIVKFAIDTVKYYIDIER